MKRDDIPARFGSGQAVTRLEDEGLLKGEGKFADDFTLTGQAYLSFLRSPYAHADITSIDVSAVREMDGVVAVYTGADLEAAGVKPLPSVAAGWKRGDGSDGLSGPREVLAKDRVYAVGQAIAMVVADTKQIADDACEAILVEFDELPAVIGLEQALAPDAPKAVDGTPDNICAEMNHGDIDACDAAFDRAAHVVKLDMFNQRLAPSSIEPRSVLAYIGDDGRLTIRLSSQMPTGVRGTLADPVLGMDPEDIRVVVGDVGGGFGMKTGMYPEDAGIAFAARETKRPVKWIASRGEDLLSAVHGRDVTCHAEMALDQDGSFLGYRLRSDADVGAVVHPTGVAIQLLIGPWVATSVYHFPVIDFRFRAVLTNTAATSAYRGAGRPEAIYFTERLIDEAARQTGIDRVELRRRNMIKPDQMPYTNPMAQKYDTGEFESIMDQGLALADWNGFDAREKTSQANHKLRGRGLATFLEWTGGNVFEERVTINITADGIIEVMTALMPMGQGIATSFAQIIVDQFGVPFENIRIMHGDTDRANGFGSAGSRSIFAGGSAVQVAATEAINKAKELAANELEVSADDVTYEAPQFKVVGTDKGVSLFDLAGKQPDRTIFMDKTSSTDGSTWPNGCHVCEVEIDPETGHVQVVSYANVNDVGKAINPMIVLGQLEGGAVQGIGQALCEAVVYEQETGQLQTGSFMDYAMPRADIVGDIKTELDQSIPCKNNRLGVKGVGELGTIGATPAVVNAVMDALVRNGVPLERALKLQMPMTQDKVWAAIHNK
ncbi:MAG: xanthine dehydrogenase family protein molybdopterin-binding subunit [Burkholderiaceae bacterium]